MESFRRVLIGLLLCCIISKFPTTCLSVAAPKSSDEITDKEINLINSFSEKLLETLNEDDDKLSTPSMHERLLAELSSFTKNIFRGARQTVSSTDVHLKSSKLLLNSSDVDGKDTTNDNITTLDNTENATVTVPPSKYSLKPDEEKISNDTTLANFSVDNQETQKNTSSNCTTVSTTVEKEEPQQNNTSSRNITGSSEQEGSGKSQRNTSSSLQLEEKESNLTDVDTLTKMNRVGALLY